MVRENIVFVSGSSRGIGKAIARLLLEEEYIVVINGKNKKSLDKTFGEFNKVFSNKVFSFHGDLTDEKVIKKLKNFIKKKFKIMDHLICNIGDGKSKKGLNESNQEFRQSFEVNFFNAVMLTKEMVSLLSHKKSNNKSITFISSIVALEYIDCPISYSCSKASLNIYSKSLSKVLGSKNIRVNTISPGNIIFDGSTWDKKIKKNPNFY